MKYGVYVIEDGGTGTRSMPFYAESDLVAKRQFSRDTPDASAVRAWRFSG